MEFNQKLKLLREEKGLSQQEVAMGIGVSQSQIGNMELGKRMPSIEVAIALANFLDVSLDYLFGDAADKRGHKIKTPAELADVEVKSVIKTDSEPLKDFEVEAIRKIIEAYNGLQK